MSADASRGALDAAVVAWTREPHWQPDETRFDALARALFAHQFERCAPYRAYCRGRGRTPETTSHWTEIPAVPTGAFKELVLTSFPPECAVARFETSGTTTAARGALHLDTLEVYEASLLASFRRALLPDLPAGRRAALRVLAPSRREAPHSSLSHMFDTALAELGDAGSAHWIRADELTWPRLLADLEQLVTASGPVLIAGTAFAFVHLVDGLARRGHRVQLPDSVRLMETGGFKGRSRELTREALYAELERALGVAAERIVNQYGMTELGSQFYDSVLVRPGEPRRKLAPPWTRVRLLAEGAEVARGEPGRIVLLDLANTGSVAGIETADLGCAAMDGFEVRGREPGAEERGCSIAADALLAGA